MNISEKTNDRWELIVSLVDEFGYLSVNQLSELCYASDITIRRDLGKLSQLKRIKRTHGGAASILKNRQPSTSAQETSEEGYLPSSGVVLEDIDAIITTTHYPEQDRIVMQGLRKNMPIIAEALPVTNMATCVAVNNYQGGVMLGRWVGQYACEHWGGRARVLDLTYHLPNTQQRSNGFKTGLSEVIPESGKEVLSLNAYSRYDTAYQLTLDALRVKQDINIIFTINDTNAAGALNACKDLGINPDDLIIVSFGLDGDITRNAIMEGTCYKASLAMFPELVGPTCVEAVIAAFNDRALPSQLITPFTIISRENINKYYQKTNEGWELKWEQAVHLLDLPCELNQPHGSDKIPKRIGVVIRFREHEWYQNLYKSMHDYGEKYGIDLKLVDLEQTLKEEVELCRKEIARRAARLVQPNDVILIDGGPISSFLADELLKHQNITVISNSMPVLEKLKDHPDITLISIGGALRHSSQVFVGPTAENTLHEIRVDKLFLMVTGISTSFGLSHTNISEVTIKQYMIHCAREVILLADHTCFGRESTIQIAPLTAAHILVTDDALPASSRLELTKQGLQIIIADTE